MSKNTICILFHEAPKDTNYVKGSYSLVPEKEAIKYIERGQGHRYDPKKKKVIDDPKQIPFTDLPDDFPGREHLIKAGICLVELVREMKDFDQVPGIGQATEEKILEYLK